MHASVDSEERLRIIVENVLTKSPITLDTLSTSQSAAVEEEARLKRVTPLALILMARADVLNQLRAEREAEAVAAQTNSAS